MTLWNKMFARKPGKSQEDKLIECPMCHSLNTPPKTRRPSAQCILCSSPPHFALDRGGPLASLTCGNCHMTFIGVSRDSIMSCQFCDCHLPIPLDYEYATNLKNESQIASILDGSFNISSCESCGKLNRLQFALNTGMMTYEVVRSINKSPSFPAEHLQNARTYYFLKHYESAINCYQIVDLEDSTAHEPSDEFITDWWLCGLACDYLGRTDETILWLKKVLAVRPKDGKILQALGVSCLKTKRWDEAAVQFETIVREHITVSDMLVDNLHFRLESLNILLEIDRKLGKDAHESSWSQVKEDLLVQYDFLRAT